MTPGQKVYHPYHGKFGIILNEQVVGFNVKLEDGKVVWWLKSLVIQQHSDRTELGFFATCTSPNTCSKCGVPLPCDYHP